MRKITKIGCLIVILFILAALCALTGGLNPARAQTAEPTPTATFTPAPIIVITPTPLADAPITSRVVEIVPGHQYIVQRTFTYGDVAVFISTSALALIGLVYVVLYAIERWLP